MDLSSLYCGWIHKRQRSEAQRLVNLGLGIPDCCLHHIYWFKQSIHTQDERRHIQELSGPVGCHLWKWYIPQTTFWPQQFILFHMQNTNHWIPWNATEPMAWKAHCFGSTCKLLFFGNIGLKDCSYALMTLQTCRVRAKMRWSWELVFKRKERRAPQSLVCGDARASIAQILSFTTLEAGMCSRI